MLTSYQNFEVKIPFEVRLDQKIPSKIEEEGREALLLKGFSQWRRLHDG